MASVGAVDISKRARDMRSADPRVPRTEAFQRAYREQRDSSVGVRESEIALATTLLTSGPRHSAKLTLMSEGRVVEFETQGGQLTRQGDKHVLRLQRAGSGQKKAAGNFLLNANNLQMRLVIDGQLVEDGVLKLSDFEQPTPKMSELRAITFRNKQPLASAAQKLAACQNGLPMAYLRTRGALVTNGRDNIVYANIKGVHVELVEEACPRLVSLRPNARDTYEEHTLSNRVRFNADRINDMVILVRDVSYQKAQPAAELIITSRGERVFPVPGAGPDVGETKTHLHPIGQMTQTIFAIGYLHYLSEVTLKKSPETVRERIKNDETLLAELLTKAGSLKLLEALQMIYPERLPTVLQLLAHTSGLPYGLPLTETDLEALLDAKTDERVESEDVEAIFATQLLEHCADGPLYQPDQTRLESAIGYAILTFTLPDADYMVAIRRLMKTLRVTPEHYSDRCLPKKGEATSTKDEPGYTQAQGIYGAYAGLYMSATALSAVASQRGWVTRDALDNAATPWDETDDTLDWLSNMYTLRVPIAQRSDAVYGLGNLLLTNEFGDGAGSVPIVFDASITCGGKKVAMLFVMPTVGAAAVLTFEHPTPLNADAFRSLSFTLANRLVKALVTEEQAANQPRLHIPRGDFQTEYHRYSAELLEYAALDKGIESLSPALQELVRSTRENPLRAALEGRRPDAAHLHFEVAKTQPDGRQRLLVVLHSADNHDSASWIVVREPTADGQAVKLRVINPATQSLADRLDIFEYQMKSDATDASTLVSFRDRLYVPADWASALLGLFAPAGQEGLELSRKQEAYYKQRITTRRERSERRAARKAELRRQRDAERRARRTAADIDSSDSEAEPESQRQPAGLGDRSPRSEDDASSGSDTDGTAEESTIDIKRAMRKGLIKRHRHALRDGEKLKNCGKFSVFPKESRAFASVVGYPAGLPLSADAEYEAILNQSGKPEYYSNESKAQLLQLEEQK
jgi:hypothetical protein